MRKILLEGLLVAAAGGMLAFVANALSPQGLKLTFNYFPQDRLPPGVAAPGTAPPGSIEGATNVLSAAELLAAQLRQLGVHLADSNQVAQFFHNPRCQQDLVIFIDARADQEYQQGHIPGAYQLDYYHWDKHLSTVLPLCAAAQQIVLYCNGGACEDSLLAARLLSSANVPGEKLYVYGGGMTEWATNGLPIERGARRSGQFGTDGK